ncbi:MAG: hypothetical protein AAGJ79_10335 [Verrucomicrobiota bacterium]
MKPFFRAAAGLVLAAAVNAPADQPIMNMMPRWDGGYGVQFFYEYLQRDDLLMGDDVAFSGFREEVHQLHIEGVYTWDRSIRATFKLPLVLDAWREVPGPNNEKLQQSDEGIGDLTLALPLKKYFNLDNRSGSWTLAPQLRVPLDQQGEDDYDFWDRVWGGGVNLGYEFETQRFAFATSGAYWIFESAEPNELHYSLDLGWRFRENADLLWETDLHWEDDGTFFASGGPALYWRITDLIHSRISWKHDFHSEVGELELDHGNGTRLRVGIGFVF